MKKIFLIIIGILIPLAVMAQGASYIIGPSDLLEISVWGEDNLSRQLTVRSDGYISLPLAGEIMAADKTPAQLQKEIEAILAKYVKEPHCAVIVREPKSKRFYVQGQVARPGEYILDHEMTLTQVISTAGGFNQWADTGDIIVLRYQNKAQTRINVNYNKIIKGKVENILIQPGDTVIIP
jgi:polysaccharide biosynthesis/export protein